MNLDTAFYFYNINSIGGIETFFYNIAKQFHGRDITIIYNMGDINQIERLKKYVRVVKYNGQRIKCNKMYYNYNSNIIDNVDANEHIQILHGDYIAIGGLPVQHEKITRYISVSEVVRDSFKKLTGKDSDVIYNPYKIEKPKRVLRLISATRFTHEKGERRYRQLAEMLDNSGIPYQWHIFSDSNKIHSPNIIYVSPRIDILNYIADSDYLVQLSNTEGFCYSIVEALSVGTPVISTDIPVLKEIGADESNAIILDFDMSNVDVNEIYNRAGTFKFKYTPPKSKWDKEITAGKSNYMEEMRMTYIVTANDEWEKRRIINTDTGNIPHDGETWLVNGERLDVLMGNNPHNVKFIKWVEIDFKAATLSSLKEFAKENGIEGYEKMKKAELLNALSGFCDAGCNYIKFNRIKIDEVKKCQATGK